MEITIDDVSASPERKKPGPLPGPPMKTYTINIEEADAEWAKRQPGGMASLIRRLLREAMSQSDK